MITGMNTEA